VSAQRDVAVLNAALAIYCGGLADSIPVGIQQAQKAIDSGAALAKHQQLVEFSQSEVK